jgi:diguanylate cyclase (GGDEF)-like protein
MTAAVVMALATGSLCAVASGQVGVPDVPISSQATLGVLDAVAELPPVPQTPSVADVIPEPPQLPEVPVVSDLGGGLPSVPGTGGSGGSPSGGGGAAQPDRSPARSEGPSSGTAVAPARGTRPRASAPAPARRRSGSAGSAPEHAAATAAPPASQGRALEIITWIVEVVPFWAKTLILLLIATVIVLAVGAHRRLRKRAAEHRHQALHDALTGLPNRTLFRDRVAQALCVAEREGGQVAVLLIDLDGFKEVNDTLGHTNGDRLLQEVAARLRGALRSGDTVARLGGDEFAVLIPAVSGEEAARSVAGSLRRTLQGPFTVEDLSIHADASVGIAMSPQHGGDTDTLIQHADVAMYLAKAARAGTEVYDSKRDHYSPERLALIGELRRAIEHDELVLYYQPQIEPGTGRVGGVEALIRWHHPERGLIPPDEFIPLAERTGLIQPLTLWILEAAIRQCASWRSSGLDLWVAANLSAANLVDADTPEAIDRLLRRWAVPPGSFRLEITETTAMADPARTRAVLARLDALGVELAIDDFGTGYSSLAYLRRLPVHELKIDRSFVSRMTTDPNDEVIVAATIDLGHNLGLRVVAEGVEDEETLRELVRRGCDLAQGYHFTKPLPPIELQSWLVEWGASRTSGELEACESGRPECGVGLPRALLTAVGA